MTRPRSISHEAVSRPGACSRAAKIGDTVAATISSDDAIQVCSNMAHRRDPKTMTATRLRRLKRPHLEPVMVGTRLPTGFDDESYLLGSLGSN